MRTCKILAITECLILVLTYIARYDSLWLPVGYGYLRDMATCEILFLTRYGYLRGMAPCKILALSRFLFLVISPIQLYCRFARYGYLRDIASDTISYQEDMATREILLQT